MAFSGKSTPSKDSKISKKPESGPKLKRISRLHSSSSEAESGSVEDRLAGVREKSNSDDEGEDQRDRKLSKHPLKSSGDEESSGVDRKSKKKEKRKKDPKRKNRSSSSSASSGELSHDSSDSSYRNRRQKSSPKKFKRSLSLDASKSGGASAQALSRQIR